MAMLSSPATVVAEGDDHKMEEAVWEFTIARSHLRDARSGLYDARTRRKKQSWADPRPAGSCFFRQPGVGRVATALLVSSSP